MDLRDTGKFGWWLLELDGGGYIDWQSANLQAFNSSLLRTCKLATAFAG
jgi:hypothetical protein